ncbi:MAG: hypothetical protein HYY30_01710 [Chloroflexi bacterium]|nr:hypothetical protein [Chloroflexota bacterium]
MITDQARPGTISVIVELANPVFIVFAVCVPIGALIFAMASGSLTVLHYVHIMTGALWTGIDLFMGIVLGPVLGSMEPRDRVGVFKRLVPKMTFLMPVLATVTTTAGIQLAQRLGMFSFDNWRIVFALVIVTILTVQGFGILLPNEIRIFRQLVSPTPNVELISRLGMRNAKLGGVQGLLQLVVIFAMANLRFPL